MVAQVATFAELDTSTLYALLRLRVQVFVVEQNCPYPELDGRDTEPGTRHVWYAEDGAPLGYLRLVEQPGGAVRIGRVCVAAPARGRGLARALLGTALELVGERPATLEAQAHLVDLYASVGFAVAGPSYVEDGIPHVPMARPAPGPASPPAPGGTAGVPAPGPASPQVAPLSWPGVTAAPPPGR